METRLVPAAGYRIETVDVRGFQRRLSLKNVGRNISAAVHAVMAEMASARILREFRRISPSEQAAMSAARCCARRRKWEFPCWCMNQRLPRGDGEDAVQMRGGGADLRRGREKNICRRKPAWWLRETPPPGISSPRPGKGPPGAGVGQPSANPVGWRQSGAERVNAAMAEVLARSVKDGRFQHIHATGKSGWDSTCARLRELGCRRKRPGLQCGSILTICRAAWRQRMW